MMNTLNTSVNPAVDAEDKGVDIALGEDSAAMPLLPSTVITRLQAHTSARLPAPPPHPDAFATGLRTVVPNVNLRDLGRGDIPVGQQTMAMGYAVGRGAPPLDVVAATRAAPSSYVHPARVDSVASTTDMLEAVEEAGEFVLLVDEDLRVIDCTSGYLRMIGLKSHQVIGRRLKEYIPSIETSPFYAAFTRCVATHQSSIQIAYSKVLGKHVSMRLHPRRRGGFIVTGSPASAQMLSGHEELSRGHVDEITKLGNRHALSHQLAETISRSEYVCLGLVEWSNHASIRDRLSPDDAEMMLLSLVAKLSSGMNKGETLYRIDTSLFAILFDNCGKGVDYGLRVREIVTALSQAQTLGNVKFPINTIAAYTEHDASTWRAMCAERGGIESTSSIADSMTRQVRLALREARNAPSGSVVAYSQAHQQRIELEGDLLNAIALDQFVLYAQPKLDLFRNSTCGAELLVRWRHPTRGLLPPGVFLDAIAELKLMCELDAWVIETAAKHLRDLLSRGCAIPLSINISVDSLCNADFVERLQEVLDRYRVPPSLLEIEIPEGALMHDVQTSTRVLARLKALGVKLSIDDFGTGYCSFRYLGIFPVDTLKIDRSFVMAMDTSQRDKTLVETMIRLGHAIGLSVVAEGAETPKHAQMLYTAGCNQLQGYVYAKPMAFSDFIAFTSKPVAIEGLTIVSISE